MRIAYVTVDPGIPVFGTKGASVHIQEVVRELIRRGHDVTVHTTRAGRDIPDDLAGLKVIETRIEADDPAARERAQQEVSARIAARIIADGADLVYERYSLFSTALAEVTDATGAAGVLEVNAPLIEEQRTHRQLVLEDEARAVAQSAFSQASAILAVSPGVADYLPPSRSPILSATGCGNAPARIASTPFPTASASPASSRGPRRLATRW